MKILKLSKKNYKILLSKLDHHYSMNHKVIDGFITSQEIYFIYCILYLCGNLKNVLKNQSKNFEFERRCRDIKSGTNNSYWFYLNCNSFPLFFLNDILNYHHKDDTDYYDEDLMVRKLYYENLIK